eukprot:gene19451-biopygen35412
MLARGVGLGGVAPETAGEAASVRAAVLSAAAAAGREPVCHGAWREVLATLAPLVRARIRPHKSRLAWISAGTRASMRDRDRLRRRRDRAARRAAAGGATEAHRADARAAAEAFTAAKQSAAARFRDEQCESIRKDWDNGGPHLSADRWRLFNRWRGKDAGERPEPEGGPDRINAVFLSKVAQIREQMEGLPRAQFKRDASLPTTLQRFESVTRADVMRELGRARSTSSSGVDGVPMRQLQRVAPLLGEELVLLVNAVIAGAVWPAAWKDAEVRPLWKRKGCKRDPRNYRPIALLPAVSRLTERLLLVQLQEHVRRCELLPDCQHGFRAEHSCEHAVTELVQHVAEARDAGDVVLMASLDAACAFDALPHQLLADKLERCCGVAGPALALLSSYLSGRRQRVRLADDRRSAWKPIESGVPQGAVLSPLLFTLYTIGLESTLSPAKLVQYADDCTIVARGATLEGARAAMNTALGRFHRWATEHRISPEPT